MTARVSSASPVPVSSPVKLARASGARNGPRSPAVEM